MSDVYSGALTENTFTISTRAAISANCGTNTSAYDSTYCLEDEGDNSNDAYFHTNWTLPGSINWIAIRGAGRGNDASMSDTCALAVYNYSSNAYVSKNSSACATSAQAD